MDVPAGEGDLIKNEGCCRCRMYCRLWGSPVLCGGRCRGAGRHVGAGEGSPVPSATCCNEERVRKVLKDGMLHVWGGQCCNVRLSLAWSLPSPAPNGDLRPLSLRKPVREEAWDPSCPPLPSAAVLSPSLACLGLVLQCGLRASHRNEMQRL